MNHRPTFSLDLVAFALGCVILASLFSADASALSRAEGQKMIRLDNGLVSLTVDPQTGRVSARAGDIPFLSDAALGPSLLEVKVHTSETGNAVSLTWSDGQAARVWLSPGSPFVHLRAMLSNTTEKTRTVRDLVAMRGTVLATSKPEALRVLGCNGLSTGEQARTSYLFLAAAESGETGATNPGRRAGVVAGWLTHDRASGIVLSEAGTDGLELTALSEYGSLCLEPAGTALGETFVIGYFKDACRGLETYADAMSRCYGIHLPPIPTGYCTWYSEPNGGAASAEAIDELAAFARRELVPLGFDTVQIDDRWQGPPRPKPAWGPAADFTHHDPEGPYPRGMAETARTLREAGLRAGLWLMPFAWDPRTETMRDHQDWFVHTREGEIRYVSWAGWCLDMTHPQARAFLAGVIRRITHEWGFGYLKLDGLWAGLGTKQLYPDPDYRPDGLGEAVFHDPSMTPVEAYRRGLQIVRAAAGRETYLLGCNIAQNMRTLGASIGRVDAMRVGRDVSTDWKHILPCVQMGSRLYFLHNRVWHNDPDCLLVREPLTIDQARAWASWIHVTGQLDMISEWLPDLPEERMEICRRTLPNTGLCGRPVDLFENDPPRVWHLVDERGETRVDTVALFNWSKDTETTVRVPLGSLDLPCTTGYTAVDFWQDTPPSPLRDTIVATLPPTSCRVLELSPRPMPPD